MSVLKNVYSPEIKTENSNTIYSHESYEAPVSAICHHSGRYLTRAETNPKSVNRFRVQHDFPGLPNLDHAFRKAAHARSFQHVEWDDVLILAITFVSLGFFFLLLGFISRYYAYAWDNSGLRLFYWILVPLGVPCLLIAIILYGKQEFIFHKILARWKSPRVNDYPIECSYEINANENIHVELGNALGEPPKITKQDCRLKVVMYPVETEWENYTKYRKQYRRHRVGKYINAGTIALNNLEVIELPSDNELLEFDHRIILRKLYRETNVARSKNNLASFSVDVDYSIRPDLLVPANGKLPRFPLECRPQIPANDSRMLELHFHWYGENLPGKLLEECILEVPDELEPATHVFLGRYNREHEEVSWHNLSFQGRHLTLRVQFENPILEYMDIISGKFTFSLEGLISEVKIAQIWDARGLKVKSGANFIRPKTTIEGTISVETQRLSQGHEHVQETLFALPVPPNYQTVEALLNVLIKENFDILRVAQRLPRLDPIGDLEKHLIYWDVFGRCYSVELLDSFDLHIVVSGHEQIIGANANEEYVPETRVDLRVRCLHDPRNNAVLDFVNRVINAKDAEGQNLEKKIVEAINFIHGI